MTAFHLLRCEIALAGDTGNRVARHRGIPIVFPELPILQFLHGEDAVTEIAIVGAWDTTNDEVLQRLQQIYAPEVIKEVFPGAKPRLPTQDPSIPRCTLPVYKPRPAKTNNPDPTLRPLGDFTRDADTMLDPPDLPVEDIPTPEEIAAHRQDDDPGDQPEDQEDLGLGPTPPPAAPRGNIPRATDLPRIVRDTLGRGTASYKTPARPPGELPDVNAGGSHAPGYRPKHNRP